MPYSNGTIYNASKFAVRGMTTAAMMDLIDTPIRVTHISPGMVGGTDFSLTRFGGTDNPEAQEKAAKVYDNIVRASLPRVKSFPQASVTFFSQISILIYSYFFVFIEYIRFL